MLKLSGQDVLKYVGPIYNVNDGSKVSGEQIEECASVMGAFYRSVERAIREIRFDEADIMESVLSVLPESYCLAAEEKDGVAYVEVVGCGIMRLDEVIHDPSIKWVDGAFVWETE